MNRYAHLSQKQQHEVNAFPMFAAFNDKQFDEGMVKLGLTRTEDVVGLGAGCFIRKADVEACEAMMDRHQKERQDAVDADTTGDGFIYDMFDYELANHEYSYTGDLTDTLYALGYDDKDFVGHPALVHGLKKAMKHQMEEEAW